MKSYIKPTSDILIHYLLGSEHNKDLLLSFVNAVLTDADMEPVKSVEIKNPFNIMEYRYDKMSILDIKAVGYDGRLFDIEVQSIGNKIYANRSLYYWAKNYSSQLQESENYISLNPVICINLLDFTLMPDIPATHTCFLPIEQNNHDFVLTDHFEIHYIELPKFYKTHQSLKEELDAWIKYFIHEGTEDEAMKVILKNNTFQKAHNEYLRFNSNDEYRNLIESRLKWTRDQSTLIESARMEGLEKGIEKGIEKGKIDIVKKMLNEKASIDFIEKVTGLSMDVINKIKSE